MKISNREQTHKWENNIQNNCVKHSPTCEADSLSASKNLRLLWKKKIHYYVHKNAPMNPVMNTMNAVQNPNYLY
jgi:hypothetical protein